MIDRTDAVLAVNRVTGVILVLNYAPTIVLIVNAIKVTVCVHRDVLLVGIWTRVLMFVVLGVPQEYVNGKAVSAPLAVHKIGQETIVTVSTCSILRVSPLIATNFCCTHANKCCVSQKIERST